MHEWGTFLGMSSSDGTPLDGMYHEEHALPAFVHGRGRDQLMLPACSLKGETPVIYFYTKEKAEGPGRGRLSRGESGPNGTLKPPPVSPSLATQAEHSGEPQAEADLLVCRGDSPLGECHCRASNQSGPARGTDQCAAGDQQLTPSGTSPATVDAAFVKTDDGTPRPSHAASTRSSCSTAGLGEAAASATSRKAARAR